MRLNMMLFDSTVVGNVDPRGKAIYEQVKAATGLKFSPHGYCESDNTTEQDKILHSMGYELKYFDGCFMPYLCRRRRE